MDKSLIYLGIFIATIIFYAGGLTFIVRCNFRRINTIEKNLQNHLQSINKMFMEIIGRLSRLEGKENKK